MKCIYCEVSGKVKDLRPYGPGGSDICFACMKNSPEREEAAKNVFGALLNANDTIGGGVVSIGTSEGPVPFDVGDVK